MRGACLRFALMLLALGMGSVSALGAQEDVIRPGDRRLANFDLTPFIATYDVSLEQDGEIQSQGYWKWHLQEAAVNTARAWRLVWSLFFPQVTVYDQIIVLDGTFAPVMRNVLSFQGNDIIDFTGPEIRYTRVPLAGRNR